MPQSQLDLTGLVRPSSSGSSSDDGFPRLDLNGLVEPENTEGPSLSQRALRTGLRVGGAIVGGVAGGLAGGPTIVGIPAGVLAGGAVGAGLGELGAEYLETLPGRGQVRERMNPYQVATQTLIGAVPISGPKAGLSLAQAGIRQAVKGAALGGTANVATNLAEGEAPTLSGTAGSAALGAVLGGGIGAATHRGPSKGPSIRSTRGYLRAAPSFVGDETGRVAPLGTDIPMREGPDASFVRAEPAQYAQREPLPPSRQLPPARGYVVNVAGETAPAGLDFGDLVRTPRPAEDVSQVMSRPAAIADREYSGRDVTRKVFSGDVSAVDAPLVQLSADEVRELRRMGAEMESVPFTPRTAVEAGPGRGGDLEWRAGGGGAPVYQDILAMHPNVSSASRAQVLQTINDTLAGKRTALSQAAIDVARKRLAGDRSVSRPILPPEAGDVPVFAGGGAAESRAGSALDDFDQFNRMLEEGGIGNLGPGDFGGISPMLAARLGGGTTGAVYGAATGEDAEDRAGRALMFGAAGAAAPSLARLAPGQGFLLTSGRGSIRTTGTATRGGITQAAEARTPIPSAGQIPQARILTMPQLTDDVQSAADSILERYSGFQRQRRGVQSVARTEGLADRVEVRTDRPLAPGTAANVERLRAYQNATATILRKQQDLEARVQAGTATPAQQLELEHVKTEAEVLTKSLRGLTAEAGRALHILAESMTRKMWANG